MGEESFATDLYGYFDDLRAAVCDVHGDWTVKGFIDVYTHIYTISVDTKVLSKVMELLLLPVVARFAKEKGYRLELARQQNHYPDLTLTNALGFRYAVDVKTTYRTGTDNQGRSRVAGMTLGTYGGYFRGRSSLRFLDRLASGSGVFAGLGVEIFDDYWMNYRTSEMARNEGFVSQPYRSLREYKMYKEAGAAILAVPEEQLVSEVEDDASLTL